MHKVDGKIVVSEDQLLRIINLGNCFQSLDGSDGYQGGRPCIHYLDPTLPSLGHCATKSSWLVPYFGGRSLDTDPNFGR